MKNFILLYFIFSMNSFIMLMFFMNLYLSQISSLPMYQLINIIVYMMWNSIIIFMMKPSMTLHIFMILIIMVSGMMILFSYFVSMVNMMKMIKVKFKYMYLLYYILLNISMMLSLMLNYNLFLKFFETDFKCTNQMMIKLFNIPNYYILLIIVLYMLLMLFVCSKICFTEKKPLRMKLF